MTTETIDLEDELPRRERRRLVTPAGVVAAAVALGALGFLGGVQVQKSRGDSGSTAAGRFTGARGGQGLPGGAQPGAQQGQPSDATIGEVSSVDGNSIYIDDTSGNTVRIRLAKGGTVTRTAVSKASEVHPGDTVIVQGETASSGTVVASSIRATASNAGGGGIGGFSGAPGATGTPGGG